MTLCSEAELRAAMDDGEFWDHVFNRGAPEADYDPDDDPNAPRPEDPQPIGRCPECGETYACGYDAEGRPMIHLSPDEDDD